VVVASLASSAGSVAGIVGAVVTAVLLGTTRSLYSSISAMKSANEELRSERTLLIEDRQQLKVELSTERRECDRRIEAVNGRVDALQGLIASDIAAKVAELIGRPTVVIEQKGSSSERS
jgi:hypothetical protein